MTKGRSEAAWHAWRESSDKFDYFVTGIALALVGYLGSELEPVRLGWNGSTLEVASVILFLGSAIAGLRRIETNVLLVGLMQRQLSHQERAGALTDAGLKAGLFINRATGEVFTGTQAQAGAQASTELADELTPKLKREAGRSERLYRWRNWLLVGGIVALIASRLAPAYLTAP